MFFPPMFGANTDLGCDGARIYHPPADKLPATWKPPAWICRRVLVSYRPPPVMVAAGSLDTAIHNLAETIPTGTLVTFWHEGERANLGFDPVMIRDMHDNARERFWEVNQGIRYGQILGTYTARHAMPRFQAAICPGLAWYGIDAYPEAQNEAIYDTCVPALDNLPGPAAISEYSPRGAKDEYPANASAYATAWEFAKHELLAFFFIYEVTPYSSEELTELYRISQDSQTG